MQLGGTNDEGDRFRREVVTSQVEHLFCSPRSARYGPYELQDEGTQIVDRLVYRYKVLDRSQNQLALQVFYGLRGIGGQLWEQEVRVLLRVGGVDHPALPRIVDGGYDEESNIAFVITRSTEYDLGAPEAIPFLQSRPAASFRQFALLADALAVLHGQGLIHRNILPSSIQVVFEGRDTERFRLQLARFEMSALIGNMLRPVYAEENDRAEETQQNLMRAQGKYDLIYRPPERLAGELETDRSDVYSLGVLAWQFFVGQLPAEVLERGSREKGYGWLDEMRSYLSAELSRKGLPVRMQDLLRGMLRVDPRTRFSSNEVVSYIARHYDALLAPYESQQTSEPYLVAVMPRESGPTVFGWNWIDHDPANDEGRRELFHFLDWELRRASLVYSPEGAEPFVRGGETSAKRVAKYVLLGTRGAWFCTPYRKLNPFGGLGEVREQILLIKYVARRKGLYKLERQPLRRRVPLIELIAEDAGDSVLGRKCHGRPTWKPLLDAIQMEEHPLEWQVDLERGLDWFMDFQDVESKARLFPYVVAQENGDLIRLRYDKERDLHRIHEHRTALFAEYNLEHRLSFGDFFGDVLEDDSSGLLEAYPDGRGRPEWSQRCQVLFKDRLDDNLIEVSRTSSGGRLPQRGWIRRFGDLGMEKVLRRQKDVLPEFLESKSLLAQLNKPSTIPGFRQRWRGVGKGLRGGADKIVQDMLVFQPFYALHGPPGTGKTTVVAHAVDSFLRAERSARILISAQSNFALDNLALRIRKQLSTDSGQDIVAIRMSSPSAEREGKVDARLLDWTLNEKIPRLKNRIISLCESRLERKADPLPLRTIIGRWRAAVETSQLELYDRIRRGANLVFATCATATRWNVDAVGSFGVYDWVIVEEAAKAWTTELAIPLVRGVRWTLIGDHLQLGAHKIEAVEAFLLNLAESKDPDLKLHGESRRKYEKVFNLFGNLFSDPKSSEGQLAQTPGTSLAVPLGRLTRQFRMRKPIARVVSRAFYADPDDPDGPDALETDPVTEVDSGLIAPKELAGKALVWLDTNNVEGCEDQKWKNPGEVAVITKLLEVMEPNPALMKPEGDEDPVAILTPYRQQITALKAVTLRSGWNERIWSIHEYQGREANVVVISLVRDQVRGGNARKNIGFLVAPEIANVLISRARRLLVIVGSYAHFRMSGVPFWKVLCDSVKAEGRVIGAAEVLKSLETRR